MLTEKGTFPEGIIVDGRVLRDFVLEEETFRHTLEVSSDPALAADLGGDDAYFAAAVMSKRLVVEGLDRVIVDPDTKRETVIPGRGMTPQMVLDLSRSDGRALLMASGTLEERRLAFRKEAAGKADGRPGGDETGVQSGAGGDNAKGGDPGAVEGVSAAHGDGGEGGQRGGGA